MQITLPVCHPAQRGLHGFIGTSNRVSGNMLLRLFLIAGLLISLLLSGAAYSASKTVLVLGDSISAEYGLPRGEGWVARLQQRAQQQKIGITLVNASISGETTSGGKTRLPALLAQHKPDIVLIELGGNDGLRGLALSDTTANLRSMITAAQQSKAQVMLVGMRLPPNFGRTYTEQFFAQYAQLAAQYKTALVPFLLDGVAEKPELFQADRIHPNVTAQNRLLDNVWPHLQPMLQSGRVGANPARPATTGK